MNVILDFLDKIPNGAGPVIPRASGTSPTTSTSLCARNHVLSVRRYETLLGAVAAADGEGEETLRGSRHWLPVFTLILLHTGRQGTALHDAFTHRLAIPATSTASHENRTNSSHTTS